MMVLANDEDMLYELLVYGIPAMQQFAEVYISDALKKINIAPAPKVAVGVSCSRLSPDPFQPESGCFRY